MGSFKCHSFGKSRDREAPLFPAYHSQAEVLMGDNSEDADQPAWEDSDASVACEMSIDVVDQLLRSAQSSAVLSRLECV